MRLGTHAEEEGGDGDRLEDTGIRELAEDEDYKYLGVAQLFRTNRKRVKSTISAKYLGRIRRVWTANTNAGTKAKAHNSWGVSVLRYYLGATRWRP